MKSIVYELKYLILLIISCLLFSCDTMYHYPSTPNIPIIDTNKIISFEESYSTLFLDYKLNVRLTNSLILQGAHHLHKGISHEFDEKYNEFGLAYSNLLKNNLNFSYSAGFGKGFSEFGDYKQYFYGSAEYKKYYAQPAITALYKRHQLGIVFKVSYIDYLIKYTY